MPDEHLHEQARLHAVTDGQFLNAVALGLVHLWQLIPLAAGAAWLFIARRSVVTALLAAGLIGIAAGLLGLPVSGA